ncbi:class I SAM-dependent methyltransferase [bacterium]|nr:class I SAM-dependent methyltransferase [bacterium]
MHKTEPLFNPVRFAGCPRGIRRYQKKYARFFKPGERVLDIGCGEGFFLEILKERGIEGKGIDVSQGMVRACRKKGLDVSRQDTRTLLKRGKSRYDGIFCAHLIEHLGPEDLRKFLRNAAKVLKTGGRLILITPNFKDLDVMGERFWMDPTHVRPYPLPLLAEMLSGAGFEILKSGTDRMTGLPGRRNFVSWFLKKIRFGPYWGQGDLFIIGVKKDARG